MTKQNLSIHPRNWPGTGTGEKKNTTKPHKGGGNLAKRLARLHARRADHTATLQRLPSNAANSYKMPGSMNQHK